MCQEGTLVISVIAVISDWSVCIKKGKRRQKKSTEFDSETNIDVDPEFNPIILMSSAWAVVVVTVFPSQTMLGRNALNKLQGAQRGVWQRHCRVTDVCNLRQDCKIVRVIHFVAQRKVNRTYSERWKLNSETNQQKLQLFPIILPNITLGKTCRTIGNTFCGERIRFGTELPCMWREFSKVWTQSSCRIHTSSMKQEEDSEKKLMHKKT